MLRRPIETTAVTGEVGPGTQVTGKATNEDLAALSEDKFREAEDSGVGAVLLQASRASHDGLISLRLPRPIERYSAAPRGQRCLNTCLESLPPAIVYKPSHVCLDKSLATR